jgi:plastocyanin
MEAFIADVTFVPGRGSLAIVDATLSGQPPAFDEASHEAMMERQTKRRSITLADNEVGIDNFNFATPVLSPVLDTDQRFSTTLTTAGTYDYFCSLHPKMQGKIIVRR